MRSAAIMKGKITNSLKPPLTKRPSEEGLELNEMPGSGACLRPKKLIDYLRWVAYQGGEEAEAGMRGRGGEGVEVAHWWSAFIW